MEITELLKLSVAKATEAIKEGNHSVDFLLSVLDAEKAGDNRVTLINFLNDEIKNQEESQSKSDGSEDGTGTEDVAETKSITGDYQVGEKGSISFRSGIKSKGDKVDPNWPEYTNNKDLLSEHLKKGLVVKKPIGEK